MIETIGRMESSEDELSDESMAVLDGICAEMEDQENFTREEVMNTLATDPIARMDVEKAFEDLIERDCIAEIETDDDDGETHYRVTEAGMSALEDREDEEVDVLPEAA